MTTGQREPFIAGAIPDDSLLNMRIEEAAELAQPAPDMNLTILGPERVAGEDDAPESSPDMGPVESDRSFTEREILIRILGFVHVMAESPTVKPGFPIARAGRVSTNSANYQRLVIWTVSPNRIGKLLEVSMVSNTPATAQFRLMMNGEAQFTDLVLDGGDGSLSLPFEDNKLRGELEIELLVISDGAVTIIANGTISGIERDPQSWD